MEKLKLYHDTVENTLSVWFEKPEDEYICQETGDEVILMKDKKGHVIGFEKLNYFVENPKELRVELETIFA